jgi:mannose-1-phosphate guanylyltransferase
VRAVVLVGGFGTRLRPLTLDVPKPMLPVGHVPIIERLVANLARGGISEVTLAMGFLPEPFLAAFPNGTCAGVRVRYAVEPEPLDTAGAIRFAATQAGIDDTFVVANGDVLTDLHVDQLVAFHRARRATATLHLTSVVDPSQFGVVALDAAGRVERFVEKPAPGTAPSNLINAGTYVLEAEVLERIDADRRVSIERETFPALVADHGVYAMATDDYWVDTGTIELFRRANLHAVSAAHPSPSPAVAPTASVHAHAVIDESVIGDGARVEADALVVGSVLMPGAVVERGAVVTRSVIMGAVRSDATVVDSTIGQHAEVAAGETVDGIRRPAPQA